MIGGKSVGVFISDVRSDLTTVSPGDQVLEINGHPTQGLTLYKATQLLRKSSSDLKLSVVENKASKLYLRVRGRSTDIIIFFVRVSECAGTL